MAGILRNVSGQLTPRAPGMADKFTDAPSGRASLEGREAEPAVSLRVSTQVFSLSALLCYAQARPTAWRRTNTPSGGFKLRSAAWSATLPGDMQLSFRSHISGTVFHTAPTSNEPIAVPQSWQDCGLLVHGFVRPGVLAIAQSELYRCRPRLEPALRRLRDLKRVPTAAPPAQSRFSRAP